MDGNNKSVEEWKKGGKEKEAQSAPRYGLILGHFNCNLNQWLRKYFKYCFLLKWLTLTVKTKLLVVSWWK